MGRVKVEIPKDLLTKLYIEEFKSASSIAKIFNCNRMTILARIKELQIPLKSSSIARMKYRKFNFSEDLIEKAYLIGFRLGDLNVYQTNANSDLIVVRCNTTTREQIELMQRMFSKYGHVTLSKGKYSTNINCYLNRSFLFLLPNAKNVPSWIEENENTAAAFIAGYIDAEGTFQINQGRGRFAMSAYDKEILYWIHQWLKKYNIVSYHKKITNKGTKSIGRYVFKEDVWRLNVNDSLSLISFINIVNTHIKHDKRKSDMFAVKNNLESRNAKGGQWI